MEKDKCNILLTPMTLANMEHVLLDLKAQKLEEKQGQAHGTGQMDL